MRDNKIHRSPKSTPVIAAITGTVLAAGLASAQPLVTAIGGANNQFWNAGTNQDGRTDWLPERFPSGLSVGLGWVFVQDDGMGAIIPPVAEPVFDSTVPGITHAYRMPEARAIGNGTNWENQAAAGTPGTFEIWFKPDDLVSQHVIWELGATNKGVAISLDGADLVFTAVGNDGVGGNAYDVEHRVTLTDTGWQQATLTIDFVGFLVTSYLNGTQVNQDSIPVSTSYRWAGGNPPGLGANGADPLFPDAGIAGDPIPPANLTDFNGLIGIHRFYNLDLFPSEVAVNYDAVTDASAAARRGDFNGDGVADNADQIDLIGFASNANTDPISFFTYPFPATEGGVQTNDPALDDTFQFDFSWSRDDGFNPGGQEPAFQFADAALNNVLVPVTINDPGLPNIRKAFVMPGNEGFRGPKFEQADDTSAVTTFFYMFFDDVTGDHLLFEAGGSGVGYSVASVGDDLFAAINTSAADGLDLLEISAADVLTPGWHRIDFVVRRFNSPTDGQGIELYLDGVQIARAGDEPGPDGVFGTDPLDPFGADDINNFTPGNGSNSNFIGGNQSSWGDDVNSVYFPPSINVANLTPFNGMVGPFSMIQIQPTEADIQAQIAQNLGQNTINDRNDTNEDGQFNFLDIIQSLQLIDAGR